MQAASASIFHTIVSVNAGAGREAYGQKRTLVAGWGDCKKGSVARTSAHRMPTLAEKGSLSSIEANCKD